MIRIHVIQHVPFEDEGSIAKWARDRGHPITRTCLYEDQELPPIHSFDLLVVMGGPMNIYEDHQYPWLKREKEFLQKAVQDKKIVLGICLGAQLIADCLGGRVVANPLKEIGWYPLQKTAAGSQGCFESLPQTFMALHWHGDTFELPKGISTSVSSRACQNQAFVYQSRVYALQFHLESTSEGVERLVDHCQSELVRGEWIQSVEMLKRGSQSHSMYPLLEAFMNALATLPTAKPKRQAPL